MRHVIISLLALMTSAILAADEAKAQNWGGEIEKARKHQNDGGVKLTRDLLEIRYKEIESSSVNLSSKDKMAMLESWVSLDVEIIEKWKKIHRPLKVIDNKELAKTINEKIDQYTSEVMSTLPSVKVSQAIRDDFDGIKSSFQYLRPHLIAVWQDNSSDSASIDRSAHLLKTLPASYCEARTFVYSWVVVYPYCRLSGLLIWKSQNKPSALPASDALKWGAILGGGIVSAVVAGAVAGEKVSDHFDANNLTLRDMAIKTFSQLDMPMVTASDQITREYFLDVYKDVMGVMNEQEREKFSARSKLTDKLNNNDAAGKYLGGKLWLDQ